MLTNTGPIFHSIKHSWVLAKCPVCNRLNSKILLTFITDATRLILLTCRKCGSLYYPNAIAPDYEIVENESSFYMRIDQAEGIDSALMPLFSVLELQDFAVIDVGCGMGFTSDFVRFQGRECLAFDPSSAAKMSSTILKIDILQEYASFTNAETKSKDKLVFASEVIEHVEDPLKFLQGLNAIAGENGYLIVTTPNAEFVNSSNSTDTIMAMLAPGQHLFLLSAKALQDLARKAGFLWAETWTNGERLFLVAGPNKLKIGNYFSRSEYRDYLKARLSNQEVSSEIRYRAFGYRLFREYVNVGRYVDAAELWARLTESFLSMGFDLEAPTKVAELFKHAAGSEFILPDPKKYPYSMALIMYFKGILSIAYDHDRLSAKPYFEAAITLSKLYSLVLNANDVELQEVSRWAQGQIDLHCV